MLHFIGLQHWRVDRIINNKYWRRILHFNYDRGGSLLHVHLEFFNTCATQPFVCTTYMQTTPLQFDFDAQSTGWQIDSRVTHEPRCTLLLRHTSPAASEIAGTGPSDTAGGWEEALQSYEHSAQCVKSCPLPTKTNGFARMLVRMLVAFLKEKKPLSFKKQQAF